MRNRLAFVAALAATTGLAATLPRPLFHATFDGGSPVASEAQGAAAPLEARSLEWTEGVSGQAVRLTRAAGSALAYAEAGNLRHERGTVSLWFRSDAKTSSGSRPDDDVPGIGPMRYLLANPFGPSRVGSRALVLRWHGQALRGDVSDDADTYRSCPRPDALDGDWHHIAMAWDDHWLRLFVDGKVVSASDGESPMRSVLARKHTFSHPGDFDRFFVGQLDGGNQCDGDIDELRIYGETLDSSQIAALAAEFSPPRTPQKAPDYHALYARNGGNPYVGAPATVPGVFPDGDLELIDEVRLDSPEAIEVLRASNRLRAVGDISFGEVGSAAYAELGDKAGSRLALRFADPGDASPLYVFDLDYPDDKSRTMDIIVQCAASGANDYTMQCGVAAGGEYPATGRILTHRCVWWRRPGDAALIFMTARDGAPAAATAVRLWRVKSGTLPPTLPAPPSTAFERRHIALYFEDPSIGYEFSVPGEHSTPESMGEVIDRTIATMRFAGEDVFAYPGAWYQGMIGKEYNPRCHAPDFLSGWYEKFDAEGDLGIFPTLNVNNMPVPDGLMTIGNMTNGALHASPVAIHDTGLPNWGGWHGTPPNFNIAHPEVQRYVFDLVEKLAEQGAPHPSFKGICLHVPRHPLLSWGGLDCGYNDYCIDAFGKATGVMVPCDRADPLRGKAYAEWLRSHPEALEKWLDWRCDVLARFWGEMARRLRAIRPDLKLWANCCTSSYISQDYATAPDFVSRANREAGIDAARLRAAIPNLVISQCIVPADYRWRGHGLDPARREMQRTLCDREETYALLRDAEIPWVAQHDRYWESPIGRGRDFKGNAVPTLSCDWLSEINWRVTTINPSGANALRAFVLPLRYCDVLGMSKGGYLIGTYGMEPYLAHFSRAFRSLPAVRMDDFFRKGAVVGRKAEVEGRTYGYIVNTDAAPLTVNVFGLPSGATDLVSGQPLSPHLSLNPYEMVSFIDK